MNRPHRKDPTLAAVLSLIFPGAGHLYCGAVGWFFGWIAIKLGVVALWIMSFALGSVELVAIGYLAVLITLPLLHVIQIYHSYTMAQSINRTASIRDRRRRGKVPNKRASEDDEVAALRRRVRDLETQRLRRKVRDLERLDSGHEAEDYQDGDSFVVEEESASVAVKKKRPRRSRRRRS